MTQQKSKALEKLQSKVTSNSQSQIEGISIAKKRGNLVTSIDESDLDIELIEANPYQPRKVFDQEKITELAEAIKENGLISPIAVRRINDKYQIIAGERRLRAFKYLGYKTIQAVIFDADDEATALMSLSENVDREDLTDYEVGQAIYSIEHLFKKKTELSRYTGKTRSDIYRYLAFNNLPEWVKGRLDSNPSLINRNNAQLLVSFFSEPDYLENKHKSYVITALNMIEAGALTQTMLMPKIRRIIRDGENPRRDTENKITKKYSINGKNIGGFNFDDNKVVIKLNSELINQDVANEIYHMVAEALAKI